jgi:spore germination protein YaaH
LSTDATPPQGTEAIGTEPDDGTAADASARGRRRRWIVLGALATLLVAVVAVTVVVLRAEDRPPPRPDIPLDTWAPYWALDRSADELPNRVGSMREVSPFWFNAVGETEIVVDPNASAELADDMIDTIRRSDARLVPSVVDATASGEMAAILADPERRSNHVETLLAFAAEGDYDGLDIDYEQFAFADGRGTWASTRSAWVTFVEQLADELHADGRTLTVSIPPVYDAERTADSGYWVYDYGAISEHVDRIRIMAYDYSVGEPGPIAPLPWVERAVAGAVEASGQPDKLVLGLPAYGRNWPVDVSGECPDGVEVPGRTSVTTRTVDELLERREAEPVFDPRTAEWTFDYEIELTDGEATCVQSRQVHYVDGEGVRQRMDLALEYGLGGVSLWALGFEDDDVWDHILPTVSDSSSRDGAVDTVGQSGAGD